MDFQTFLARIEEAKVILIGEWHHYIGDTAVVIQIVNAFIKKGRKPTFYMEHFPGPTINEGLQQIKGKDWGAINSFLNTPIQTDGKGLKSPLQAWENIEEEWKLKALLRFSQIHDIEVKGHDLDYFRQIDHLRERGEAYHLERRDTWMEQHVMSFINNNKNNHDAILFCFVGEQHLKQVTTLIQYGMEIVCIAPVRSHAVIHPRPIVSNRARFVEVNFHERWQVGSKFRSFAQVMTAQYPIPYYEIDIDD